MEKSQDTQLKKAMFQVEMGHVLKLGLDMNHIYLLEKIEFKETFPIEEKTKAWIQGLLRKGLIKEDYSITDAGALILEKLRDGEDKVAEAIHKLDRTKLNEFDTWWKTYPGTDTFIYKDKMFKGTRSLRVKRDECRVKFYIVVKSGKYTAQELIDALALEVEQKKEASYNSKENKLKYMKNSLTYLNSKDYEGFVELAKQLKSLPKEPEKAQAGTFSI